MHDSQPNTSQSGQRFCVLLFASTIFVSAFLLFQVQPLISKFILPWFGGSPAVWSTCMLFFQVTLFAGYVYAHLTSQYLSPRWQAFLHMGLLLVACFLLPITPDNSWKPAGDAEPTLRIVALLTMCVGLPYFLLSSTGPLLQSWFSSQAPGTSPYRLYSLSNIGSLLALVSYPFVVEPAVNSPTQAGIWSIGFALFALLCAVCAVRQLGTHQKAAEVTQAADTTPLAVPTWADRLMWFGLAMVASVMLLATTNQVCLDVATVPFLWILPLTLYLMSFILCFDADRWYSRKWYMALLVISLMFVVRTLLNGSGVSIILQVLTYLAALYFCCMVCHGELAQQKPHSKYLTQFYLLMSAGGAGGGLFVGLIAPYVFPAYWELHFGIVACLLAALAVYVRTPAELPSTENPTAPSSTRISFRPATLIWPVVGFWVLWSLQAHARDTVNSALEVSRNFYGVLRITEECNEDGRPIQRTMLHGRIVHGTQFTDSSKRKLPTTYYSQKSGVGLAMRHHKTGQQRHIGIVGLGVGTLAAYGKTNDHMRFYEINPEVIRLAESHFSFLKDSDAKYSMIVGDARLSLEHEPPQEFDILVLDAFSGDAIPTHLLTRESAELYKRNLAADGILAIHISNLHFDLRPIVQGLASECGWHTVGIQNDKNEKLGTYLSQWILLSAQPFDKGILESAEDFFGCKGRSIVWTDEWSNLLSVLR